MRSLLEKIGALSVQDITLVILCALAIYLLRVRDKFDLEPTWRTDSEEYSTKWTYPQQDELLPKPIITDLEGDGINELITVTRDLELQVLVFPSDGKKSANLLPHLIVKNNISLEIDQDEDGRKSFPVGMDTGYIDEFKSSQQVRKQVIVVLLDNWVVLCYNHQLDLQWKQQLMDIGQMREEYYVKAVGILITSHRLKREDTGTIIVGAGYAHKVHGHGLEGPVEKGPRVLQPQQAGKTGMGEETYTHFSSFALSGSNGTVHWHHLPGDFENKGKEADVHHWKLGLKKQRQHHGELHWSKYNNALLKQMPHSWTGVDSTRFELANMRKSEHKQHIEGDDASEPTTASNFVGLASDHLIGLAYGGLSPHSRHEHVTNPNTVVIHNNNGIEVLNLHTGQPLTKLKLQDTKSVYIDLNEDGILDQIRTHFEDGHCEAEATSLYPLPSILFSGPICSPPSLWSSFSLSEMFFTDPEVNEDTHVAVPPNVVKTIAKKSGPFHHLMGNTLPSKRRGYDSLFITSNGRLTSYSPIGEFNWQVKVPAQWSEMAKIAADSGFSSPRIDTFKNAFHPSITPFTMQIYGIEDSLLVVGWDTIAVVDLKDGILLAQHSIPCQANQGPVMGDFTNDGWTDIIILCPNGNIGFTVHRQPNYIYMAIVSVTVVLGILLLSWMCKPEKNIEDFNGSD